MNEESLELIIEDETAVLKIKGEVLFDNSNIYKEKTKELIKKTEYSNLIIDLIEVPYIDSSGIGFLLSLFKFMREKDEILKIANANEKIKKVLEITKINSIIDIHDSLEEALTELNHN